MEKRIYEITSSEKNTRVDKFLSNKEQKFSRSYLQKLIDDNYITINGSSTKNSYKLKKVI